MDKAVGRHKAPVMELAEGNANGDRSSPSDNVTLDGSYAAIVSL